MSRAAFLWLAFAAVTVPAVNKRDQPIAVEHESGAKVQAIFAFVDAGGSVVWQTLPDDHFKRGDTETILAAPPGEYVITTGDFEIIKVVEDGQPDPRPQPNPVPPEPDPSPPVPPEPVIEGRVWVTVFEQIEDRAKNPKFAEMMVSRFVSELDDRDDFEFRQFDVDSIDARKYRPWWDGKKLPVTVLYSDDTKEVIASESILSQADMASFLKKHTGREVKIDE